jgi:hypothetical protein
MICGLDEVIRELVILHKVILKPIKMSLERPMSLPEAFSIVEGRHK